jgi:hypothetical protein
MNQPNKVCSECGHHAVGGWYSTPLCQVCFSVRGAFISREEAQNKMMDITRKLELIANLKPGDPWPSADLGGNEFNYAPAISAMCAEARAEIQRLRQDEESSYSAWLSIFTPSRIGEPMKVFGKTATQVIVDDPHEPMTDQDRAFVAAHMADTAENAEYKNAVRMLNDPKTVSDLGPFAVNQVRASIVQYEKTGEWKNWWQQQATAEPSPEPWGSPFAMNTENWK